MRIVSKGGIFRQSIAITLGNFDGLHKGHMRLVSRLVEIASKTNMKSMVYVIDNDSRCKILTKRQQIDILDKAGVDYVVFRKLSDELKNMEAYVFLKQLKERFSVGRVVVGDDYRFGKNRRGDIASINKFFEVDVINRVDNVSSTTIRDMIREGNVAGANRMLGREFSLEGRVVEGLKNGRKIGFRTANLEDMEGMIIPKVGVYKTRTKYNNNVYNSITNIGTNPTVGKIRQNRIETNILDFSEDIYDKRIEVSFVERIRDEKKFENLKELAVQIKKDVEKIRESE